MKATELRIGNYIQGVMISHNSQIIVNNHIEVDLNIIKNALVEEDSVSSSIVPIPLTEEWLLKLGFNKLGDGDYLHDHLVLTLLEDTWYVFFEHFTPVELLYVHRLQNLYFALTGEELTLKETV